MPTLTFLFRASADDEARQAAIEEIKRWPEVSATNFLKREADNPEVRRIAFAEVPDEKNLMRFSNVCKICRWWRLLTSRLSARLSNPPGRSLNNPVCLQHPAAISRT